MDGAWVLCASTQNKALDSELPLANFIYALTRFLLMHKFSNAFDFYSCLRLVTIIAITIYAPQVAYSETVDTLPNDWIIRASSELKSSTHAYSPRNAFDGNSATAWVEGGAGPGDGEWIEVEFPKELPVDGIAIQPGYRKSPSTFANNVTPSFVELSINDELPQKRKLLAEVVDTYSCSVSPSQRSFSSWNIYIFDSTFLAKRMRFKFDSPHESYKYEDMGISEIIPIFSDKDAPPVVSLAIKSLLDIRKSRISRSPSIRFTTSGTNFYQIPTGSARIRVLGSRWVDQQVKFTEMTVSSSQVNIFQNQWLQASTEVFLTRAYSSLIGTTVYFAGQTIIGQPFYFAWLEDASKKASSGFLEEFPLIRIAPQSFPIAKIIQLRITDDEGDCLDLPTGW